jgi:predicted short-subunit dehydrogenase-like oxidoreductase (DUF2520 family)
MQVVIIGTGNVATLLGRTIKAAGHTISGIYGRNAETAIELAEALGALKAGNMDAMLPDADLYILAISDASIGKLAGKLNIENKLLVHTAGSVPMDILKDYSPNYGVLYPLQSLRKELTELPMIPILVDANTPDNLTIIQDFAATLSGKVKKTTDEERFHFHLSAILVSNFTNHLYSLAADFCKEKDMPFSFLHPLIHEVVNRLDYGHPSQFQTGPAVRNDQETIKRHLEALSDYPEMKNLYAVFTEGIQAYFKKKG